MHYSGDREALTYDGNGVGAYFGSGQVKLPVGGGSAVLVINGTGFSQAHAVKSYDAETRTYTLTEPLAAELSADAWVQTLAYQGKSHFIGNTFTDTGACQLYGAAFDQIITEHVMRRTGGSFA